MLALRRLLSTCLLARAWNTSPLAMRLAVLAVIAAAAQGFAPGAPPRRATSMHRAASRAQRTIRMGQVRIVFRIKPNGIIEEEVQGLKGPACYKVTDSLNKALGAQVVQTSRTEEYYEQPEEARLTAPKPRVIAEGARLSPVARARVPTGHSQGLGPRSADGAERRPHMPTADDL